MKKSKFKRQIDNLYENNCSHKKAVQEKLYSKKDFMKIANLLLEHEKIEAIAPIADNPNKRKTTKTSILRNWYMILTDKRILFASPTLV